MSSVIEFKSEFEGKTLFQAFVNSAQKYGSSNPALEDATGGSLTYKKLLIGANVLARKFKPHMQAGEAVGVLLPNAVGGTVTLLALQSLGCVPAMLNFSAGPSTVVSACETAAVKTVLSSHKFIEKGDLQELVKTMEGAGLKFIWLEDVRKSVNFLNKIVSAVTAKKPIAESKSTNPAVILFTSGSEGLPKGVVLSHENILANIAQVGSRIKFSRKTDKVFSALPVFHSLGLTGGMMLPLVYGVPLFLYPSPLHYKIIPKAVSKTNSTILFGTDTFLGGYARMAKDEDFTSLRMVVAGAEPVKLETTQVWKTRFDVDVLEGFGMTEAAPVLAVNTIEERKNGTVGKLLPGIEARLEEVEGIEDGGKLIIKGPNLMLGYMKADNPGVLQPRETEWHDTGDIVNIDKDGFVTIRGRVKRFAKIAGEMVSLTMIESIVNPLAPDDDHAVVSVPDKRKGEKIILMTTSVDLEKSKILEAIRKRGQSDLLAPSLIEVVNDIPLLGSGKIDYTKVKSLVS